MDTHIRPSGFRSSTVTCIAEPLMFSTGDSKGPNVSQRSISFNFFSGAGFYFIPSAQKGSPAGGLFLLRNLLPVLRQELKCYF